MKYGVGELDEEPEGRIITLEFESFYMVNVYTPNAKRDLSRLNYRLEWEDEMISYLKELDLVKPVIFCGDLNVAHQEIDLKNPKPNIGNSGFTNEERGKMTEVPVSQSCLKRRQPGVQSFGGSHLFIPGTLVSVKE